MILRRTQKCLLQYTASCCHANIHTTPPTSARDPKKEWQAFADRMKRSAEQLKAKATGTMNNDNLSFKKITQNKGSSNQSSSSNKESFQVRFMNILPTPTEFNGYFDRAFSRLPSGGELMNKAPPKYRPFLQLSRVDKPIGSWLLFLPGAWGICIASPTFSLPSLPLLVAFGAGKQL